MILKWYLPWILIYILGDRQPFLHGLYLSMDKLILPLLLASAKFPQECLASLLYKLLIMPYPIKWPFKWQKLNVWVVGVIVGAIAGKNLDSGH